MSNSTFTIGSVGMAYERAFFNEAYRNERSLEVALGRWFLRQHPGTPIALTSMPPQFKTLDAVIEVGAVMCYYGETAHEVTDLTDPHPINRKVDALTLDYTGRNVLCVSTVEHLNGREFGNQSDEDSITLLKRIASQAARYVITWGIGYNATLDAWVKAQPAATVPRVFMQRIDWRNRYRQVEESEAVWATQFGHSDRPPIPGGFNNANVVVIVTNVPELLAAPTS